VAPGHAGRATAIVFAGNSLALVLGTPVATFVGQVIGWRAGTAVIGAAAALTVMALLYALPPLASESPDADVRSRLAAVPAALRSRSLFAVCGATVLVVVGHFVAYTYIARLVQRDAGFTGVVLSALLLAYGLAGIVGIGVIGRTTDRRPRRAAAGCALTITVALAVLAALGPGSGIATIAAVVGWGGAFTAIPVCLQAAVLRVAPESPDTASALYVVSFQVGIGGGALLGSVLVGGGRLAQLPAVGLALAGMGTIVVLAARRAFPSIGGPAVTG
jgi:predicted MFS family arabinose efflux permease